MTEVEKERNNSDLLFSSSPLPRAMKQNKQQRKHKIIAEILYVWVDYFGQPRSDQSKDF